MRIIKNRYLTGAAISSLALIVLIAIINTVVYICSGIYGYDAKNMKYLVIAAIIINFIVIFYAIFHYQYIVVTDEGITLKMLYKEVKSKKWGDIKEISVKRIGGEDMRARDYIIFVDDTGETLSRKEKIGQNHIIKLPYSKQRAEIIYRLSGIAINESIK